MKPAIVALCLLAAVVCVIALLPEKVCRAPHPVQPAPRYSITRTWYLTHTDTDQEVNLGSVGPGVTEVDVLGKTKYLTAWIRVHTETNHPPGD
uniref:Putative secreted protein n=1 Tax=Ixodes ricinus TaxID=34613 RepID=A0A090XE85_IXORI